MSFPCEKGMEHGLVVRGTVWNARITRPEPFQLHIQKRKYIRWCALQRASNIGETRDDPPVQRNCINAARKVASGSVRPENRSWPTCLAMTAPALVLLS